MKKEFPYILCILFLFFAFMGFPTDFSIFLQDSTLDINIHDTYFVIGTTEYLLFVLIFLSALVYFFRVLFLRFKNRLANYIYLISNTLFIIFFTYIIICMHMISQSLQNINTSSNDMTANTHNETSLLFYCLYGIQIVAIMFQTIVALQMPKKV